MLAPAAVSVRLTKEKETKDGGTKTVSWVTPHVFRHTCASLLFDRGRNIKQVAGWLGHSDPAFTLKAYVHLIDDGIGDASAFDDLPGGNQEPTASAQLHVALAVDGT